MKAQLVLLLLITGFFQSRAQETDIKKLDTYITNIEHNNKGIGAVAISKNGTNVYSRVFGNGNLTAVPQGKQHYQIGSITKMLTAIMIYQLEDKEKLNLDEKIDAYFPDMPNAKKISIYNLLGHNSGLGDFVGNGDTLAFWLAKPVTEQQVFDEIKKQGTLFEPGDHVEYSNSGYYLLTKILEKKYNKKYKAILNESIIKPLRLMNTNAIDAKDTKNGIAVSYAFMDGWNEVEEFYFPNVAGVGDVVSTPEDLNAIAYALFNDKLISAASREKMKPLSGEMFGFGMMEFHFYDKTFFGHGGDTMGTHSLVGYNPADGTSVALTLNGMVLPRNEFLIGLLNILYTEDYTLPDYAQYTVDPETFGTYEGVYGADGFPLDITILRKGNELNAQATGQSTIVLEPYAKDKFRAMQYGIDMRFNPSESKLTFSQGGAEFTLQKKK